MSSKSSCAIIGGTMTSISRPGRWTRTLFSFPISLVTFNRMRAGFYPAVSFFGYRPMRLLTRPALLALFAFALPLAAAPRISFVRTLPATHDLGRAERLTVLYAFGDNDKVSTFVDVLVDHTNRSGVIRLDDATNHGQHLFGERPDDEQRRRIRREHPADLYLGVNRFTCEWQPHSAQGSTRDVDGARVKRLQVWFDALC